MNTDCENAQQPAGEWQVFAWAPYPCLSVSIRGFDFCFGSVRNLSS